MRQLALLGVVYLLVAALVVPAFPLAADDVPASGPAEEAAPATETAPTTEAAPAQPAPLDPRTAAKAPAPASSGGGSGGSGGSGGENGAGTRQPPE